MTTRKKKLTGGGRFDPNDKAVYFAAGNMDRVFAVSPHKYTLMATNDLMGGSNIDTLVARLDVPDHRLMLDSGIFWLTNKHKREHPGMTMDEALSLPPGAIDGFDELWNAYIGLISEYEDRLWGYIELDQGGAENKRKTRAKIEALGFIPIPVYHPMNDGWDYFDELCSGYDRICVGNVVQADSEMRRRLLHTIWERHRKYPDVWIHLLGLTPNEMCTVYPPNSADSATFCYSLKYGASTTPFATSMLAPLGKLGSEFSYLPGGELGTPGGIHDGMRFLSAHAVFMQQNWRNQQDDYERVFEQPALPPVNKREKVPLGRREVEA